MITVSIYEPTGTAAYRHIFVREQPHWLLAIFGWPEQDYRVYVNGNTVHRVRNERTIAVRGRVRRRVLAEVARRCP